MNMTRETMLKAVYARDPHYNGEFITGVLSTGIYCLPSCPARNPKAENIEFFSDETSARDAGLRPCKRCRPDLFYRNIDPDERLAGDIAARVYENPAAINEISQLASLAGVGVTKLNTLFRDHYHTTPSAFLQRVRVENALRQLINGGNVAESAEEAGFQNLSTFHENIVRWAALRPGDVKHLLNKRKIPLQLPKDFRFDLLAKQHQWDNAGPDSSMQGIRLRKALTIGDIAITVELNIDEHDPGYTISSDDPLSPADALSTHASVLRMLGLPQNPSAFEAKAKRDSITRRLIGSRKGLRISGPPTYFEGIVWVVVGQAVSLAAAHAVRGRLIELVGRQAPEGLLAHPSPGDIVNLGEVKMRSAGLSAAKAGRLYNLSKLASEGRLDLDALSRESAGKIRKTLSAIDGLGPWSVNYLMMRAMGLADCVPLGDSGLHEGLKQFFKLKKRPTNREADKLMERFAPFRSLATFHFWMS